MSKQEVTNLLGVPDKIYQPGDPGGRMMSKKWICLQCGEVYSYKEEHNIPAPCAKCGHIGFMRNKDETIVKM